MITYEFLRYWRFCRFSYNLVPETMSLLHVWSKVCIAPIHVRSDGSNADCAWHIEVSHADFAPHNERRHSFSDQQIAQIAIYAKFIKEFV